MKVPKKNIALIVISIIGGLVFASYFIYNQTGRFGEIEIFAVCFTAVLSIIIGFVEIRKANK